jgi:hypothetical protein
MLASSHNCDTFSGVVKATNGLNPALGNTDSNAAATSRSIADVEAFFVLLLCNKK